MIEAFMTAFIISFVVIDPIGNAPIFLAVTEAQDRARRLRAALEGTAIATAIMLFFALCGAWILGYLNISEAAFKIAGGLILFLVALELPAAKRQQRKRDEAQVAAAQVMALLTPPTTPAKATTSPSIRWPSHFWPGHRRSCRSLSSMPALPARWSTRCSAMPRFWQLWQREA